MDTIKNELTRLKLYTELLIERNELVKENNRLQYAVLILIFALLFSFLVMVFLVSTK